MAKGVGLRLLSRRGSWVQIPPSAPQRNLWKSKESDLLNFGYLANADLLDKT
jgi:hypothetical protein